MSQSPNFLPRTTLSFRTGLATIAMFGLLSGSALSITGYAAADRLNAHISDTEKLSLDLHVVVYLLLAIFSTVGLYGAIFQRRTVVQVFVSMLFVQVLFGLGSGIFVLYLLFQKASTETVQACVADARGSFGKQLCERSPVLKGVSLSLFLVICFIEILGLFLGSAYSSRLRQAEVEQQMDNPDDAYWKT